MITHIRMKNFKSWKDSGKVELAPLTGFFGTNSSGKSSLLQMLLLLKQSSERSITEQVLFFGDDTSPVNFGSFSDVIHGHTQEGSLELEFGGKLETPITVDYSYLDTSGVMKQVSFTTDSFSFDLTILWNRDVVALGNIQYILKSGDEEYIAKVDVHSKKIQGPPLQTKSRNLPIYQLSSEFEKLFSHVYYLGPARVHPQRLYHWEGKHPKYIGQYGEEMISVLLSARVDHQTTHDNGRGAQIEKHISEWLQRMDLAYSFSIKRTGTHDSRDYEMRIQKSPDSTNVNLSDMGYGLSQFLPVLVLCYYAPEGSTLILEQPGIHLHPKVQSQLADLLIEVVNERKLQILVESHSEHLLNRLQRRIAEEKISVDKTALYFCRNENGVSNIERLKMDEFGNISNWPENFFGDEMGDLFAMTDAQRERQKRAEGQ